MNTFEPVEKGVRVTGTDSTVSLSELYNNKEFGDGGLMLNAPDNEEELKDYIDEVNAVLDDVEDSTDVLGRYECEYGELGTGETGIFVELDTVGKIPIETGEIHLDDSTTFVVPKSQVESELNGDLSDAEILYKASEDELEITKEFNVQNLKRQILRSLVSEVAFVLYAILSLFAGLLSLLKITSKSDSISSGLFKGLLTNPVQLFASFSLIGESVLSLVLYAGLVVGIGFVVSVLTALSILQSIIVFYAVTKLLSIIVVVVQHLVYEEKMEEKTVKVSV